MSKKLIALLLALVFAVSCFPIGIFAVEPVAAVEEPAAPGAIIYVESTYCVIGKTVEVDICILNNPGVAGAKFSVSFDEGLTLVGASEEDGVFDALDYTAPSALENGAPFNWDSLDAVAAEDGKIITLTFEASEDLTADEELTVTVSYKYGDIYDSALDSIAVTMVGGMLEVIDYVPGDANGDGTVNGKDVTVIRRYNANWDEDINLLAADVNGDGSVNGKDVTQIRRYNANWDVDFLPGYVACVHSVKAVEAKDPTCTEAGNVAYWLCSLCDARFSDAEAQNEISELETVVPANGHTEVVDKAVAPTYDNTGLTEGLHCSVCDTVLTAQEVVPKLEPNYYSITYSNLQGAASPALTQYASHLGVSDTEMPQPERAGYNFDGWYTAIEGGTRVVDIPAGTEKDYHLYARWSIIEYSITYYCGNGTNSPSNIEFYTVDTAFTFVDATLEGLDFYRWVDQNGNTITEIKKGNIGNLVLTAEYTERRFTTVQFSDIKEPKYKNEVTFARYDTERNLYTYVYYLGYVANVPLTQQSGVIYTGVGSFTQGYEEAIATTESVEKGFSKSQSDTISTEITSTITAKEEAEVPGAKASVEASISASIGASTTVSHEENISFATTRSEELVKSFTFEIPDGSPHGYYRAAYMGTLDMFIAVVYDPINDEIDVVRYSILRDDTKFALDYSQSPEFDGHIVEEFDFVMPEDVEEHILYLSEGSDGLIPQISGDECSVGVYTGADMDVVIPAYLNGKRVTSFGTALFAGNTDITSVTFGEGITAIPDGAFEGCTSLTSVVFNGKLTEIGANAFKGCTALEFDIPETVTKIGDCAFDGCQAMDNATISSNVTSLGTTIFNNCGDLSLTIHSGDFTRIQTAIYSGATNVCVDWKHDDSNVKINHSSFVLYVPPIQEFKFNGNRQIFENLRIVCDAANATIEHVTMKSNGDLTSGKNSAIEFVSSAVTLRNVTITSNTTPLIFTAASVELIVAETVTATAQHGYAGLTARNMTISSATGEAATLTIYGGNGDGAGQGIEATDITFDGFLTVNVNGGAGNNGNNGNTTGACEKGAPGDHGKKGAIAILAQEIVVNGHVSLSVTGGNGGRGGDGGNGWSGMLKGNSDGGRAGNGGNGGDAISANSITVLGSGCVTATGGRGGDGGRGGNGDKWLGEGAPGGEGGSGGSGGSSYNSSCVIVDEAGMSTFYSGASGSQGDNGSGDW